jgi:hypothetical protein
MRCSELGTTALLCEGQGMTEVYSATSQCVTQPLIHGTVWNSYSISNDPSGAHGEQFCEVAGFPGSVILVPYPTTGHRRHGGIPERIKPFGT